MGVDAIFLVANFLLSFYIYQLISPVRWFFFYNNFYGAIGFIIGCTMLWMIVFSYNGIYESQRAKTFLTLFGRVALSAVEFVVVMAALLFLFNGYTIPSMFLGLYALTTMFCVFSVKFVIFSTLKYYRKKGRNLKSVIIVGNNGKASEVCRTILKNEQWGLKIMGFVTFDPKEVGIKKLGIPVLAHADHFDQIMSAYPVDKVIVTTTPTEYWHELKNVVAICETYGVPMSLVADFIKTKIAKTEVDMMGDIPIINFTSTPNNFTKLMVKRCIDFSVSLASLIVLCPLFLVSALLIKVTSEGPVFFRQERVGVNGKKFNIFKFRSMQNDAEQTREQLLHLNEMSGPVFKITEDPRITKVGKFLRKFSIDELPQLINVLMGEMSLVGPRPPIENEVVKYEPWQRRRLSVKPGLTCIWQVSGRNKVKNFEEWMEMDLDYIDNWSLGLDMKLIAKTIPVVFGGKGAM